MKMLENAEGTVRYEFYTTPIRRNNIDNTIVEERPTIRYCKNLIVGSTCIVEQVTGMTHEECVQRGNKQYMDLRAKGFKVVTERSFA